MKRTPIFSNLSQYPEIFSSLLEGADLYDSSCSPEAKVIFIDRDCGYYLKSAQRGSLRAEAELTEFFHRKGLSTKVVSFFSDDRDWLLTEKVRGEDGTFGKYLENPKRLCDTIAELLRELHESDPSGCPVENRTENYLALADENYQKGAGDLSLFGARTVFRSVEEARRVLCESRTLLKADTLIHGDYCLPNIILDDWRFGGFIDLGNGGVGDRHIDLFWGAWTLVFNLGTDKYCQRFLDAYGRDKIDTDALRAVAAAEVFG